MTGPSVPLQPATKTASPFRQELSDTLRLAGPLVLANLLQMAIYAIDVMFVARLGELPLAAVSLATAVFGLMVWSMSAFTGAVAPLIAAELGQRSHAVREVRRSVRMALWLAVACGLIGMVICQFGEAIMRSTGQDAQVSVMAGHFIAVLALALIPQIVCNVLRIFVAALGRPGLATLIIAMAIAVNALGNYALVFGNLGMPQLGLQGSAWATVITSYITLLAYLVVIRQDRYLRRYRILGRWWRGEWARLREIVRIGIPIGLTVIAEAGMFNGAAFLMGRIGPTELAGHTMALQIAALAFQIPFGVAQAATIRVGYHFGAADRAAIDHAGKAALLISFLFAAFAATVMLVFPRQVLSIYVDVDSPANKAMVSLAVQYLAVAAAFQLFDGVQAVAAGALRGLQDTRVPMIIALAGYWLIGSTICVYLGLWTPWRGLGVWFGLASGLIVAAFALVARWQLRERLGLVSIIK